ncbi:substrate-binding periplasmic protein [Permianibacter aggregans]|uniref:ABC-type amino acid transport substrate-binding protein n=1 Tax=Permianibacter aggregans TaxID=1510150 RepID=A0A4R6URR9_9GAMM|nr:transporter substrate-binding domain-containing protein [Permianibacter aggregans]QGX39552.1 transporter substrate-binding domain-containing protein [Permianibacter aggregans]TDQ49702.1 ABC-type amino acid transport substrate-binding protein [Permianibacter aggregans]
MRLLVLLLWSVVAFVAEASDRVFRIGVEMPPQELSAPAWQQIRNIFQQANYRLEWVYLPGNPSRLLRMLELGSIDVLPEGSIRPEREPYTLFSKPYRMETTVFLARKEKASQLQIHRLQDILDNRWRVIDADDGWFGAEWQALRPQLVKAELTLPARDPETAIRLIMLDRADLLITTDAWTAMMDMEQRGLTTLPYIVNEEPVHLMFSKMTVDQEEVDHINKAIQALSDSQHP